MTNKKASTHEQENIYGDKQYLPVKNSNICANPDVAVCTTYDTIFVTEMKKRNFYYTFLNLILLWECEFLRVICCKKHFIVT